VQLLTVAAALGVVIAWLSGRLKWKHHAPDLPIICIIVASYLSMLLNPSPESGYVLRHTLSLSLVFALYFIGVQTVDSPQRLRIVAIVLAAVCILASSVGMYEFLSGQYLLVKGSHTFAEMERITGLAGRTNATAFQAATGLVFLLGYALLGRLSGFKLLLAGAGAVTCTAVILLTLTRSVWLGTAVGLIALTYYFRHDRRLICALLLIAIFVAVMTTVAELPVAKRLTTLGALDELAASDVRRLYHVIIAYEVLKTHPIFGIGWGNFQYMVNEIKPPDLPRQPPMPPHNAFAYIGANLGLLGLLSYLWLLWVLLRQITYRPQVPNFGDVRNMQLVAGAAIWLYLVCQLSQPAIYMLVAWVAVALNTSAVAMLAAKEETASASQAARSHAGGAKADYS